MQGNAGGGDVAAAAAAAAAEDEREADRIDGGGEHGQNGLVGEEKAERKEDVYQEEANSKAVVHIWGILFAKFDLHEGPKIVCSTPRDLLGGGDVDFKTISQYFFLHSELNSKIISLRLGSWRILGVPVKLDDASVYPRNSFQFAFCIVCHVSEDVTLYRDVILQLTFVFKELETSSQFLLHEKNEPLIQTYLDDIYKQLKSSDVIYLPLQNGLEICFAVRPYKDSGILLPLSPSSFPASSPSSSSAFFSPSSSSLRRTDLPGPLREGRSSPSSMLEKYGGLFANRAAGVPEWHHGVLRSKHTLVTQIQSSFVPLPTVSLLDAVDKTYRRGLHLGTQQIHAPSEIDHRATFNKPPGGEHLGLHATWLDCTLVQILPLIDGVTTVKGIAGAASVSQDFVATCLAELHAYGLIIFIDIFNIQNRYRLKFGFGEVWQHPKVCAEAPAYLTGGQLENNRKGVPTPSIDDIIFLYTSLRDLNSLTPTANLQDFAQACRPLLELYGISLRHFVAFGYRYGFLRRVHEYPVLLPQICTNRVEAGGSDKSDLGSVKSLSASCLSPISSYVPSSSLFLCSPSHRAVRRRSGSYDASSHYDAESREEWPDYPMAPPALQLPPTATPDISTTNPCSSSLMTCSISAFSSESPCSFSSSSTLSLLSSISSAIPVFDMQSKPEEARTTAQEGGANESSSVESRRTRRHCSWAGAQRLHQAVKITRWSVGGGFLDDSLLPNSPADLSLQILDSNKFYALSRRGSLSYFVGFKTKRDYLRYVESTLLSLCNGASSLDLVMEEMGLPRHKLLETLDAVASRNHKKIVWIYR